jgi:bifunctional non-homologous end joining protein LigD
LPYPHDGFRIIARKERLRVRLHSCPGNDLTGPFPLIVETLANLRTRSCIIDGEAVACDDNGLAVFDRIRYRRHDRKVFLYAFDLIELDGADLRRATRCPQCHAAVPADQDGTRPPME